MEVFSLNQLIIYLWIDF